MGAADNGNDTWLRRRFGTDGSTDLPRSTRAAWYGLGLTGSAVLLAAFYGVLHQSLDRAQQHWAEARRAELHGDPCNRSAPAGDACATGTIDAANLRAGVTRLPAKPAR